MNKIAESYRELIRLSFNRFDNVAVKKARHMTEAISQAVAYTSINLGVKAVLAPTASGNTAKMIAKYRPGVPIIAITGSKQQQHKN